MYFSFFKGLAKLIDMLLYKRDEKEISEIEQWTRNYKRKSIKIWNLIMSENSTYLK